MKRLCEHVHVKRSDKGEHSYANPCPSLLLLWWQCNAEGASCAGVLSLWFGTAMRRAM